MKNRGGAGAQAVSSPPFPLIQARNLNAPKPLICMAELRQSISSVCCWCFTEGRFVNQIFRAVRKSLQRVANGTRFVRGGCSGVLPTVGILSNKQPGEHFFSGETA